MINLLSNAIKYTESGFVRVQCEIDSYNEKVRLSVQDSGAGM